MPHNVPERRREQRIADQRLMTYTLPGERVPRPGQLTNLSGRGMMFLADELLPLEVNLEVLIEAGPAGESGLHARVKVVRAVRQRRGERYEVGAIITQVIEE